MTAARPARRPPATDPAALEAAALAYLGRFMASREQVRRVLERRIRRAAALGAAIDEAAAARAIAAILDKLERLGVLDDRAFAEVKAQGWLRRGRPPAMIRAALAAKGAPAPLIEETLDGLAATAEDPEWQAALAFARRRRLGPFGPPEVSPERRRKELAALARAGFSAATARRLLGADMDDLNDGI